MSTKFSVRHKKILEFLVDRPRSSIREIGIVTGITSTSVVNYYLGCLEKMGFIERERKISRGLSVTSKGFAQVGKTVTICPHCGKPITSPPMDLKLKQIWTAAT